MNKNDFIKVLENLGVPFNEGIIDDFSPKEESYIAFWCFLWDPISSSGAAYTFNNTYQVSFVSQNPYDDKLLNLVTSLFEKNHQVQVSHEYIQKNRVWHSYFSIDIIEDICSKE